MYTAVGHFIFKNVRKERFGQRNKSYQQNKAGTLLVSNVQKAKEISGVYGAKSIRGFR